MSVITTSTSFCNLQASIEGRVVGCPTINRSPTPSNPCRHLHNYDIIKFSSPPRAWHQRLFQNGTSGLRCIPEKDVTPNFSCYSDRACPSPPAVSNISLSSLPSGCMTAMASITNRHLPDRLYHLLIYLLRFLSSHDINNVGRTLTTFRFPTRAADLTFHTPNDTLLWFSKTLLLINSGTFASAVRK